MLDQKDDVRFAGGSNQLAAALRAQGKTLWCVAEALARKLSEWDRRMIKSCLLANKDSRVSGIEKEFDEIVEN